MLVEHAADKDNSAGVCVECNKFIIRKNEKAVQITKNNNCTAFSMS